MQVWHVTGKVAEVIRRLSASLIGVYQPELTQLL